MCGIVFGDVRGNKACKIVMKRYKKQQTRGKEGYGAISVKKGKINNIYRAEQESGMNVLYGDDSETILFHHRRPTSTPNYVECTHPITVENDMLDYGYLVVHNGVITNCDDLRKKHEAIGFEYTTVIQEVYKMKKTGEERVSGKEKFNDSESLAIDLALAIQQEKDQIESLGGIAFVAMQYDKETKEVLNVFFGRNYQSPLKIDNANGNFILASEGNGVDVKPHTLFSYNIKTKKITERKMSVGFVYKEPTNNLPVKTSLPETKIEKNTNVIYNKEHIVHDFDGTKKVLSIPMCNGYVLKTGIFFSEIDLVTRLEWEEYFTVMKDIDTYSNMKSDFESKGITFTKEDVELTMKELSKLYQRLGYISRSVTHRARLLNNK